MTRSNGVILSEGRHDDDCGGILHLAEALERDPEANIVLYNRVSSAAQAGRGNAKLDDKTHAIYWTVHHFAKSVEPEWTGKIISLPSGREEGKLSMPRQNLDEAVQCALAEMRRRKKKTLLVAFDVSRFLRSESYHRQKNKNVRPMPEEFDLLRDRTCGLTLATFLHPAMSEADVHRQRTKLTGLAGRPRSILWPLSLAIIEAWAASHSGGRVKPGGSLDSLADRFDVKRCAIQRLLAERDPYDHCQSPGRSWKEYEDPSAAYRKAREKDQGRRQISSMWSRSDDRSFRAYRIVT
jgi:hypothetical protein